MQLENIALIDNLYAAFLRGDLSPIFDLISDDTEWIVYGPEELPFTGKFNGPSGVKQFLEALATSQDNVQIEVTDRLAQGNKVVFIGTYTATIVATKKTLAAAFVHAWTIENGKITKLLDFFDTAGVQDAYVKP